MRRLCWLALAVASAFMPMAASAAPPPDLPAACVWTIAGAAQALTCPGPDGHMAIVSISGLSASSAAEAKAGNAAAIRNVARFYMFGPLDQRDPPRAIALFEAAAVKGDTRAMLTLAVIHRNGASVPRDNSQAVEWFRKAAEAGSAEGMYYLGAAYHTANGVAEDDAAALKWLRDAAKKGSGPAMAEIGAIYFNGKGVLQDYGQAAAWFAKAAEAGSPEGVQDLAFIYGKGLGVGLDKARSQSLTAQFHQLYGMSVMPTERELQHSFPVEAAVAGVEGRAVYQCRLGQDRSLEDCLLVGESPGGLGFGAAGWQLLPKMRLGPGLAVGTEFNLPIRFALPTGVLGNLAHAEECAAEGLALRKRGPLSGDADWWARYWVALADYQVRQAGGQPSPDRLDAAVGEAANRLAQGGDGGLFGLVERCRLK
jgi:TPR repeat protein